VVVIWKLSDNYLEKFPYVLQRFQLPMNLKIKKIELLTILPILMLSLFNDDLGQAFAESQIEKTQVETTVANDLDYILEYKVNDDEDIPERSAISIIKLYISTP